MECPKCGGGSYLSDEELVQLISSEPASILLKAIYTCRACSERFSRLVVDDLNSRKKQPHVQTASFAPAQTATQAPNPYNYQNTSNTQNSSEDDAAEGLKFF